jgi:Ni/Fe-hydrogenase subunit HybB-like protein
LITLPKETAERWGYSGFSDFFMPGKAFRAVFIALAASILFCYAVGLDGMASGYRNVYGVTREIPWGVLISGYVFCVVTSTGLCIVSSVGHVFGHEPFMPIAKRAVFLALIFLVGGFSILLFDLENPLHMIWFMLSPNLRSNMWWMGLLYGLYLCALSVEYLFLLAQNHRMSRLAGFMAVLCGVAAHSNLGAIFGMLSGRDYWYGPYFPIYFVFSAIMSGGGAILFFTCVASRIEPEIMNERMERAMKAVCKLTITMISVVMFFTVWETICGFVSPEKYLTLRVFLTGPYAYNYWIGEVLCGLVLPLALLIRSKGANLRLMLIAGGMMLAGIFFMRYDFVLAGQIVPVFHSLGVEEYRTLLIYRPSFHEIAVVVGGLCLVGFLFLNGERVLGGHRLQKHEIVPPGGFICPGCGAIHYRQEGESEEQSLRRYHGFRAAASPNAEREIARR